MGFLEEVDAGTNLLSKGWGFLKQWFASDESAENFCDDYYYEEYNKKLYIKKNGDGMIVSSFTLKVKDPVKVDGLIRTLDIHDAKDYAKFESFDAMKSKSLDSAFSECGFWYRSDNDVVTDVEEFYSDHDASKRFDDQFISIKLIFDTAKLEPNRTYRVSYAFSVPGLFPIMDGRFDTTHQNRANYPDFKSHVSADHIGHHLRFSAYFEDGIEFKEKPKGYAEPSAAIKKKNKKSDMVTYSCVYKNNIFYHKYHFEVNDPQEYTFIHMKWNVKNPKTQ